jgi:hypothetical protein
MAGNGVPSDDRLVSFPVSSNAEIKFIAIQEEGVIKVRASQLMDGTEHTAPDEHRRPVHYWRFPELCQSVWDRLTHQHTEEMLEGWTTACKLNCACVVCYDGPHHSCIRCPINQNQNAQALFIQYDIVVEKKHVVDRLR